MERGFRSYQNSSSSRKVPLDWQLVIQFAELIRNALKESPLFVWGKVYNSTINSIPARKYQRARVPTISVYGLHHTHASILLFAGVSIANAIRRLAHASMTTTQNTYLHVIQELENQDIDLVMKSLFALI